MADVNANIGINIDSSNALTQLKALQRQISQFHTSISRSSEAAALAQRGLQKNLLNSVNAISGFTAEMRTVKTSAESFTNSLEKNKFSMREYFRYAGASTKTFGRLFRSEFDTIGKVSEERVKKLQTQYIKMGRDANGAMQAMAIMPTKLNMDDYTTKVQIAAQKQALFNQLMKQGSTNLLNFGKNTQWAGRQLMVGFTLPLMAVGTAAAKAFMDMEAQAIRFKKVYGDLFTPQEETQQALDNITELGKQFTKYGVAVSTTVGLAAEAAAAGFSGLDLQRQTTEATRLSILGQVDSQKALETTISLQNAFSMSSENLASSIDFLNAVENQTVVSLDDITTAIPKVAPVIQQLGGDVKDLAFFMAAMKEGGINASEGANALKSGLAALINPTGKASDMLKSYGINANAIVESNKGDLKATVIGFAQALNQLDPLARARAIEQMFGKFQFARLSTLFANVAKDGNQAARVLDLANSSVEDLAALSEKELGMTAESSMNKFKKAVEDLKIALVPVGQAFLEAATPIVEFVGNILEKFANLSSGTKRLITLLTVGIGAVGPVLLMTFGLLANGVANIIKLFLTLRGGYQRLTGQSQILGEQTQYMTMEQLDAAAAAHSLNQTHATLTQTFTAEVAQINKLISAYNSAAGAARNFSINNPGMMMPGRGARKLASGIVSVPGPKGAGDVVPAMLSPGEAVIPAKFAKKYAPLIAGMVAGNIPGYEKGRTGTEGTNVKIPGGFAAAHFGGSNYMSGNALLDMLTGRTDKVAKSLKTMVQSMENADGPLTVFTNEVVGMSADLNEAVGKTGSGKKVSTEFAKQELTSTTKSQVRDIELQRQLEAAGVPIKEIRNINKKLTDEITTGFKDLGDITEITAEDIDDLISTAYKKVAETDKRVDAALNKMKEVTTVTDPNSLTRRPITKESYKTFRKNKAKTGTSAYFEGMERMVGQGQVPFNKEAAFRITNPMAKGLGMSSAEAKIIYDKFSNETKITLSKLKGDLKAFTTEFTTEAAKIGHKVGTAAVDATATAAGSASPSKKTRKIGEDIGRGLEEGMKSRQDDVALVGSKLGQAATTGVQGGARSIPFRAPGQPGFIAGNAPASGMPGVSLSEITANARRNREQLLGTQQLKRTQVMNQRMDSLNKTLMGGTFALTSLAGAGSMAGGTLGNISQQVMKYSGLLFALMTVTQLLTQAKISELAATRAGTVAKGMGSLTGVKGLFSKGGGFAGFGKNLLTAGKFALRFAGPIGLATSALMVGYGAYKLINNRLEENRQKLEAFGDAVSTSKDQIKSLGDYFGVVPIKTGLENTAQEKLVSNADRAAINQFKESDTFTKDFAGDVKALSRLNNEDATLALQTKGAELLGKGFTKDQVSIIITAIQEEAGKSDLNINFKSIDLEKLDSDIRIGLGSKLAVLPKFINDTMKKEMYMAENGQWMSRMIMGPEAEAEIENQGKAIKAYLNGISGMIQNGTISFDKFNQSFDAIGTTIKNNVPDSSTQLLILNSTLEQMDSRLAKAAIGIGSFDDKLLLAKASALGLNLEVTNAMANALMMASLPGATAEDFIRASAIRSEVEDMMKTRDKLIKELNKSNVTGVGAGESNALQERIKGIQQQTDSFILLRNAKIDEATATELSNDAAIASLVLSAEKNKTLPKTIALIHKYTAALNTQASAEKDFADPSTAFKNELERLQKVADFREKLIDIDFSSKIKKENNVLKTQEKQLENINTQIEQITKSQIDPIRAIIDNNNFALEKIALQEDAINEKYNKQIEALEKISTINQDIANTQKQRLSIADALTRGDISTAAQLVQEARAEQAQSAVTRQKEGLTATRDASLTALGRNALEKQNKELQLQINTIESTKLKTLQLQKQTIEDSITSTNRNITALNEEVLVLKEGLDYSGKTRENIDDLAELIQAAEAAGIKFNDVLLAQAGSASLLASALKNVADTQGISSSTSFKNTKVPDVAKNAGIVFGAGQGINRMFGGPILSKGKGGMGAVKAMAFGGRAIGSDTVSAMLTPGEFVMNKRASQEFGPLLSMLNESKYPSMIGNRGSAQIPVNNISTSMNNNSTAVYNYSLGFNINGNNSNANDIARAVMKEIKNVDSQRIRGQRV